jgi:CheY-like chemotaxis protein
VLVVEDDLVSQRVASGLLERRGCEVVTARNGLSALDLLERERFDLVLMDIQMPELDGVTATRIIRQREREKGTRTPIFVLTAGALEGERERCLEAGADGFLTKPLQPDKLDEMLSSLDA